MNRLDIKFLIVIAVAGVCVSNSALAKKKSMYAYDLGTLGGAYCQPSAINDSGQITGYAFTATGTRGFITGAGGKGITDIGTLGGDIYPVAINTSGQLVGSYSDLVAKQTRAFMTSANGTELRNVEVPQTATESFAMGINKTGQVVGLVDYGTDGPLGTRGFFTGANGKGYTELATLGGKFTAATGINSSGQVIGTSRLSDQMTTHSFITGPNGVGMTDLGTADGVQAFAYAINDAGEVSGRLILADQASGNHQFLTGSNGASMIDLGTLNNGKTAATSIAYGINNQGTVVGYSTLSYRTQSIQATMTDKQNSLVNLNDRVVNLPVGVKLNVAVAINASGQIAASGTDGHGYIVCPRVNCAAK